jgi:Lipocalin-like domain
MRAMAVIGAMCLFSLPVLAEDQRLEGTYKLISSTRKILETGQVVDTYGKLPNGYIHYGRDGRMLVVITSDKNERPAPKDFAAITDEHRIKLFKTMIAYGGTYKFDGRVVEHYIDISWNEAWTGTTQVRDVRWEGDKLILTTRPAPSPADGKMSIGTITWQKSN